MKTAPLALLVWAAALASSQAQTTPQPKSEQPLSPHNPCSPHQVCHECLRTPTCAWCSQPGFNTSDGALLPRCYQQNRHARDSFPGLQCRQEYVVTAENSRITIRNDAFRKASEHRFSQQTSEHYEAVQIRPQHVKLRLRVSEAYNLQLEYSQAQNYPVDLYYLMDLSKSMEDDKEKLSSLGDLLARTMENITTDFRLGFGSFVDKVVMPYVSTVPKKLKEPCEDCKAPYGYRNHMSLSGNTELFAGEVHSAAVSGNLDAPEGGFDAIMQAIVCRGEIGWREKARRLLVFSTDASFHYAGDGKLGGIIKPNDGECHMENRMYTHSTIQDYPSVAQVNQKVKQNGINLIFAVTEEQINIYNYLKDSVQGASAGQLSADSSNVVELVQDQYNKITSTVEMKDTASSGVKVSYFSSCHGGGPQKETNKCDGFKVGDVIKFTAKIEVTKCPEKVRNWVQRFEISPVAINESIIVDLEMICDCPCERPNSPGFEANSPSCNHFGNLQCGVCTCDATHFGRHCECNTTAGGEQSQVERCRPDNTTEAICSNRGICECGICQCYPRKNPLEEVDGPFCECDNFSCSRYKGQICGGHGKCVCGKCVCDALWTGEACECFNSNSTCIAPNTELVCSGKGKCNCGVCECEETDEGRYSGAYCHLCPTCKEQCEQLRYCVHCQQFETNPHDDCKECPFVPIPIDVIKEDEGNKHVCSFIDDDDCRYTFAYEEVPGKPIYVEVQETKECPPEINILGIVLGVIAAIVLVGLAFLLLWKVLTTIHDRREFARFEKERMNAKWDTGENPIYKQATSTFKNPTYGGK